jgi:hypothetical protein
VNVAGGSSYYKIIDNLEFTGLCSSRTNGGNNNVDVYLEDGGSGITGQGWVMYTNDYIHGWTVTASAGTGNNALACNGVGGGNQSLAFITALVVDGSDSNPAVCAWGIFPSLYHFKDSMIRYTTQGIAAGNCHDIHDNIFEHFHGPNVPTHGNVMECNYDSTGNLPNQPQNTPNVVYNNIMRHDDPTMVAQVGFWFCPNGNVREYYFNNLMYDIVNEGFSIAGPAGYGSGCSNSAGQFMFNNTLVDMTQPCNLNAGNNGTGGQYLTVYNEHLINSGFDQGQSPGCTGSTSATNLVMTDATATAQGYTTGSSGTAGRGNTCANDSTKPCAPTSSSNGTVAAGTNEASYCSALASYSSEPAIGTEAANACQYGTTDGCAYNATTHTMICPSQTALARPGGKAWDVGAYQYTPGPAGPNSLTATPTPDNQ